MRVEDLLVVCDNLCEIADEGVATGSLSTLDALAYPASTPRRRDSVPDRLNGHRRVRRRSLVLRARRVARQDHELA